MDKSILVAVVGRTDPIRSMHDGPILHIVRHYHPRKVFLILTEEIGKDEEEYHYNEAAIHLLAPDCQVETIRTGIKNPHSYDDFSVLFLNICNDIKKSHPEDKILLNITSGTPQMETVMCMIAISDPERYQAVQVATPERSSNRNEFFDPRKELIEEWFEMDLDNEPGVNSRCHVPGLLNFRRPIIQFQIESLIQNYDYAGAFQLYQENRQIFSGEAGLLLEHAKNRLNLQNEEAEKLADELGMKKQLYPVARLDTRKLVEFFNSMKVKQFRGELNDFAMRLEILTLYLALYVLENGMKIKREEITKGRNLKNSYIMYLSRDKCTARIPGIECYLDEQFSDKKLGAFEWGKPLNALSTVHIVNYLSKQPAYQKYELCAGELMKWADLSGQIRNPVAHTITVITEESIRQSYGKNSGELCKSIRTVLIQVFGNEAKPESFEIYDRINQYIHSALEKQV